MSGPLLSLFFLDVLSLFCAIKILFCKEGRGQASYVKLATYKALSSAFLCQGNYGPLPTYLETLLHTAAASKLRL